jgi:transposase
MSYVWRVANKEAPLALELPTCILVDPAVVQCCAINFEEAEPSIRLRMDARPSTALCPKCTQPSGRIHSRYRRKLADLPWANIPVLIELGVRRFFCNNAECACLIFSERLTTVAAPWARRTKRLADTQSQIGLVAGGSAGADLCQVLGCPAEVDLLLALMRALPMPDAPTPRVLGVDDWAKRKGQSYGTILIDHERQVTIELLPDRMPETLAQWLREHPGVEIVTRDRAGAYAQGIREGAPGAVQVADRWHLLKNLAEAVTKVFHDHQGDIQRQLTPVTPPAETANVAQPDDPATKSAENQAIPATASTTAIPAVIDDSPSPLTAADQRRRQRASEAHALRQQGWQVKAIARHLNCHPKTISRYLQRQLPLTPRRATRSTKLDAFKGYLLERWNEGCHNASQLFRDIEGKGYAGSITLVRGFAVGLRCASGIAPLSRQSGGRMITPEEIRRPPTCRHLAWLTAQSAEGLDEADQQALSLVSQISPSLRTTVELAQQFAAMVCQRQPEPLDAWLDQASRSGLTALRSFASGLRGDYDAVRAALTLRWSNGRTEGHINRLKCLKRQMYGRCGLDLLRRRMMAA